MPEDRLIDRVCEEFGCVPSVAIRELDLDAELVMRVMTTRVYARAKAAYEHKGLSPEARAQIMRDPMVQMVREIDGQLMQEALAKRNG